MECTSFMYKASSLLLTYLLLKDNILKAAPLIFNTLSETVHKTVNNLP